MSRLFLRGHQSGGMSNCFDWYKMWKSCPGKPVCPCLDVKACRTHKSSILIAITGCRPLIPVGTCLSLRKEKPLHWSFSMLCLLLIASLQWYILSRCSGHITHNMGLALFHIFLSLPMSCTLAPFHSVYYWKTQHTWVTVCNTHVGSLFPFLQRHVYFSFTIKGLYNTQQDNRTDIGRASHQCQVN